MIHSEKHISKMNQLIHLNMSSLKCFDLDEFLKENQHQFAISSIFLFFGIYLVTLLYADPAQNTLSSALIQIIQIMIILSSMIFWAISWNIISNAFIHRAAEHPIITWSFDFCGKNVKLSLRLGDMDRFQILPAFVLLLMVYWAYLSQSFSLFWPIVMPLNSLQLLLFFIVRISQFSKNTDKCLNLLNTSYETVSCMQNYCDQIEKLCSELLGSRDKNQQIDLQKIRMMISSFDTLEQEMAEHKEIFLKCKSMIDIDEYCELYSKFEDMERRTKKSRQLAEEILERYTIENSEEEHTSPSSVGSLNCDGVRLQ